MQWLKPTTRSGQPSLPAAPAKAQPDNSSASNGWPTTAAATTTSTVWPSWTWANHRSKSPQFAAAGSAATNSSFFTAKAVAEHNKILAFQLVGSPSSHPKYIDYLLYFAITIEMTFDKLYYSSTRAAQVVSGRLNSMACFTIIFFTPIFLSPAVQPSTFQIPHIDFQFIYTFPLSHLSFHPWLYQ
jgi:hypothetical protein